MRISFFLLVLLGGLCEGHAQAILSTKATVFFYVGVENPIAISVPNYSCKDFYIESPNCDITRQGCSYKITPRQIKDSSVLYVRLKAGKHAVIDSMKVQNRWMGKPVVDFKPTFHYGGPWFFYDTPRVAFGREGFDVKNRIVKYTVSIMATKSDSIIFRAVNLGSKFSKEVYDAIYKMKNGESLFIENIEIEGLYSNCWFIPFVTYIKM